MIETLVLFGATGDLAARYVLPALAALHAARKLPDGFRVIGSGRDGIGEGEFRERVARDLSRHAAETPAAAHERLLRSLRYRQADVTDPASVAAAVAQAGGAVAAYLALPPAVFPAAVTAVAASGLPAGCRIALEKPFGEDLDGAVALNRLLERAVGEAAEGAVFRVDHVLGMATVQNLLAMRLAGTVLENLWNSTHIEQVEVLWEETIALEGRAGYFDTAGTLKDVMQNHMLQVLSLLAMESPTRLDEKELRARKVDVLRSIRPPDIGQTRRARYTAGRLTAPPEGSGDAVPAYADEDGVEPERQTETFAEVVLELAGERWAGTPFVLRAGKALSRRRKMAIVRFRSVADELRIGFDGPEDLTLQLTGGAPGAPSPLLLRAPPPGDGLPAYGRVLLDFLSGGSTLSVRRDEAEQAWRVVTPVLEAWKEGRVPLEEYRAGSAGPA